MKMVWMFLLLFTCMLFFLTVGQERSNKRAREAMTNSIIVTSNAAVLVQQTKDQIKDFRLQNRMEGFTDGWSAGYKAALHITAEQITLYKANGMNSDQFCSNMMRLSLEAARASLYNYSTNQP